MFYWTVRGRPAPASTHRDGDLVAVVEDDDAVNRLAADEPLHGDIDLVPAVGEGHRGAERGGRAARGKVPGVPLNRLPIRRSGDAQVDLDDGGRVVEAELHLTLLWQPRDEKDRRG